MKDHNTKPLPVVKEFINKRDRILAGLKDQDTPVYLFDRQGLDTQLKKFKQTFVKKIPDLLPYYAMKANPYRDILTSAVKQGYGIDVSSGHELSQALEAGAQRILFTGPGKTQKELQLFLNHTDKVILNIDNFSELDRIANLIPEGISVRAGVRIYTSFHGNWNKFGIPLARLAEFWQTASKIKGLLLQGIQVHMSWNESAKPYELVLREVGEYLRIQFSPQMRKALEFIDFGGGFVPHRLSGYYVDRLGAEMSYLDNPTHPPHSYKIQEAVVLEQYANQIGAAIDTYLRPLVECSYFCEPGRIIATPSMHIALRIVDVKDNSVVLDGGNNCVGWERMEEEYHPVINLSNPSEQELKCLMYGSLCTPHDIWGFFCYAQHMNQGDVILVPNQGAYAFTLAQNFIKPIPPIMRID